MLVKVQDSKFVRDTNSMALLNTDIQEKNEYYNKLQMVKRQKEEINNIKAEINDLKDDVGEIKSLLRTLIEKG